MRQIYAVANAEFKTRLRGKYIWLCVMFLIYLLVCNALLFHALAYSLRGFIYDDLMNNCFNVVKISFPITLFCFDILSRDRKSVDMDIYRTTNANAKDYYWGKILGNFVYFLIVTFIISIIHAISMLVLEYLKIFPANDSYGLSVIDMVCAFLIVYIIRVLPAIIYGIILPLTISNYVHKYMVLIICAVIEITGLFLPPKINFLHYIYWTYNPIYESAIQYPKYIYEKTNHYGYNISLTYTSEQKWLSVFIITLIVVVLYIVGYKKFQHDMLRKELKQK